LTYEEDICKKLATNNVATSFERSDLPINDFTLICSDKAEVPVNKKVLSERSPVFQVMFKTDMVERERNMAVITDIDSSTMRQLIDFLYTGSVDLYTGAAKNLLYAAEKYELVTLKNECHNVLMTQIANENVFEILETADIFSLRRLECKCLVFIVK
jgi:speckle-type POZ protein